MQDLTLDKTKFDLSEFREMAKDLFSVEADDFTRLKNQKWYHRFFNAITFGSRDKKVIVKDIKSLAALQALFMQVYKETFRNSDEEINRLIDAVIKTNVTVKKIYLSTVAKIKPQEELKNLDDVEAQYLLLLLEEYAPMYSDKDLFQRYKRGVAFELQQQHPNSSFSPEMLSRVSHADVFYRCILELSALDGTLYTHEFPERIYDAIEYLNTSPAAKKEIEAAVEREMDTYGVDYFCEKYSNSEGIPFEEEIEFEAMDDVLADKDIPIHNEGKAERIPVRFDVQQGISDIKTIRKKKIGLVLAGGGAKGAYQIGIWKALHQTGLDQYIDAFSGTSVGGLNAALFMQGDYEKAEEAWMSITPETILKKDRSGLIQIIENYLDMDVFDQSEKNCYITCLRSKNIKDKDDYIEELTRQKGAQAVLRSGRAEYFNMRDFSKDERLHLLLATSAIPFIYPKEKIGDYYYMDGGIGYKKDSDNLPIRPLYEIEKCDIIITMPLVDDKLPVDHSLYPRTRITEIEPKNKMGGLFSGTMNFTNESAKRRIDEGYQDTIEALNNISDVLKGEIGYFNQLRKAPEEELKWAKKTMKNEQEIENIFRKEERKYNGK